MTYNKTPKNAKKFYCESCDFGCSKKSEYVRHLHTSKHKILTNTSETAQKNAEYTCQCGKQYKHRQSLNNHKRKCTYIIEDTPQSDSIETEDKKLIRILIDKLAETGNNFNNSLNNNFNINMFLNEQCKDAINMSDFLKTLQISADEIRRIGSMGQTEGMANIMISNLNKLDMFKRPMHCSDIQNETIYIKDQDKWEIESIDKPKLKEALDKVSEKSIEFIPELTQDKNFVNTLNEVTKQPREDKKIISKIATSIPIEG